MNPVPWSKVQADRKQVERERREALAHLQAQRWPERAVVASNQARMVRHFPRLEEPRGEAPRS